MLRTQIYLTQVESDTLQRLAKARGTTQSQLVREAIDLAYLRPNQPNMLAILAQTAGSWQRVESGQAWVDHQRDGHLARRLSGREGHGEDE
jgi:hypothetical protein